jgi:hypothetical protein
MISSDEAKGMWARMRIQDSGESGGGHLAAAVDAQRIPGLRFGPYRGDEFSLGLCLLAWLFLSIVAYLMFF